MGTKKADSEPIPDDLAAAVARLRNPYQVVRVRTPEGDQYTTTRHLAALHGHQVLEGKTAKDRYGRWLPAKPHTDLTVTTDTPTAPAAGETGTGETPANEKE